MQENKYHSLDFSLFLYTEIYKTMWDTVSPVKTGMKTSFPTILNQSYVNTSKCWGFTKTQNLHLFLYSLVLSLTQQIPLPKERCPNFQILRNHHPPHNLKENTNKSGVNKHTDKKRWGLLNSRGCVHSISQTFLPIIKLKCRYGPERDFANKHQSLKWWYSLKSNNADSSHPSMEAQSLIFPYRQQEKMGTPRKWTRSPGEAQWSTFIWEGWTEPICLAMKLKETATLR